MFLFGMLGSRSYVHGIVYPHPILKSRIGDITAVKITRKEGMSVGAKYFLRIYEDVRVNGADAMVFTVVVFNEKGNWSLGDGVGLDS